MDIADRAPTRAGLPRPVRLVMGALLVGLGVLLTLKPFGSLAVFVLVVGISLIVTGVDELIVARSSPNGSLTAAGGALALVAGITALLLPGITASTVALLVGAVLVLSGTARVISAVTARVADAAAVELLLGIAAVLLGLVALGWPDVTVLAIGVVFGIRLTLFGLTTVVAALRGTGPAAARTATKRHRRLRLLEALGAAVLAVLLVAGSAYLHASEPSPDAFYNTPAVIPGAPGSLIRSEAFTRGMPTDARAWRILYSTTKQDGSPAVASGFVAVPGNAPGPFPVIIWTHGTTGVARGCAPTLSARPFDSGDAVLTAALERGWGVVATDYIGLGTAGQHQYLVGAPAARAALDSLRAAYELPDAALGEQSVVWGHSQGGASALWVGQLAPEYAPELRLRGVAAVSAAANLPALGANLRNLGVFGELFGSLVLTGYGAAYPDVRFDDYVRPLARLPMHEMAARCANQPDGVISLWSAVAIEDSVWATDPATGPLGARLAENVPNGPYAIPVLLAQGAADPLVIPASQTVYADALCSAGYVVDYRLYEGRDHLSVLEAGAPLVGELIDWTQSRFEGGQPGSTCAS